MASMVKEKRRGKKKAKEKCPVGISFREDEASSSVSTAQPEAKTKMDDDKIVSESTLENDPIPIDSISDSNNDVKVSNVEIYLPNAEKAVEQSTDTRENILPKENESIRMQETSKESFNNDLAQETPAELDSYKHLNEQLKKIVEPESTMLEPEPQDEIPVVESVMPSAPTEQIEPGAPLEEELPQIEYKTKSIYLDCMLLKDAILVYEGHEMAAVQDMSGREEAEVEAGPDCAPDHPLIDLLSTFRSSIRAVERERLRLASNFIEEETYRSTLWKIEKKHMHMTQQCKCGLKVDMKVGYEHAELVKERLPVAKMKLEGLLKDVQESFCHHQHAAMLAHCQIEEFVSEVIKFEKRRVRETLSLILQALRACDGAPEALPAAIQRWAEILACTLVDERDLRQLLFVIHHMFRQTRSVRWAARVLHARVTDSVTAARVLAVLNILLSKLHLESAEECVEETAGAWEEVGITGGHGAVSEAALRERDLIALVRALPLQHLVAKLALFSQSDFRQATEYDWGDDSGGKKLFKCCCGVRVLLAILYRAVLTHRTYARLHSVFRELACSALTALACLYRHPRTPYLQELEVRLTTELHAAFADGFLLFGTEDLETLPTLLLTDAAAMDYCLTFIMGLHEQSRLSVDSLWLDVPVLPCSTRVRVAARAAVQRTHDHQLARIVLDFLLQTGCVRKSAACKLGCADAAREAVPPLLAAHPALRALALRTVAELAQVESLEPSTLTVLQVNKWRPLEEEMQAVLDDWAHRCPTLLQQLLLQLDYTPHTGIELGVQVVIGRWLCAWSAGSALQLEQAWRVLLRLRTHRAAWRSAPAAPPPEPEPCDLFSMAHAVLASDWGHSIPLICTQGVHAIFTLCATRPREAVHCLAPVMLLMRQSPESISLTPKFAELFTILLSCGPNLVQRALGRGGASGAELLLRLVLSQVLMKQPYMFPTWLPALWKVPAALSILDIAALAVRDWFLIDQYANTLLQDSNAKEHLTNAVRFAFTSPLLCESLLRAAHSQEITSNLFHSLINALCRQKASSQRIHVDNALMKIKPNISAEELIIYRCANAALVAPFQHPSHLPLWRLFMHIYLQRPRGIDYKDPRWLPCGPLFFSGLIKTRTLAQIKKRLLETATYHQNEALTYKPEPEANPPTDRVQRSPSILNDNYLSLFPALTITDLTGEPKGEFEDSDTEDERSVNIAVASSEEAINVEKKRKALLAAYHTGAEKMMRDYHRWLEEGEKVQASPQNADIAHFILPQALEEAWQHTLSRCQPPPNPELDTFIRPEASPPYNPDVQKSLLETAIASILKIKCRSPVSESFRSPRTTRPRADQLDDKDFNNIRSVMARANELLKDIEKYSEEWDSEVNRISSQDNKLWAFVSTLRIPHTLPPLKKQCANNCKPLMFYFNASEYGLSVNADRGVRECRAASLAGIRRLAQARPHIVRSAAGLIAIARRIRSADDAVKVLQLAWRCAGQCKPCSAGHTALIDLFNMLAERWITKDGSLCKELLAKGCEHTSSALQQSLCGSLVRPRSMQVAEWSDIYVILLKCGLPSHKVFSFLSRFQMSDWSKRAEDQQRLLVLEALLLAAQKPIGSDPDDVMLQELIGVHAYQMCTPQELMWLLLKSTGLSTSGLLPVSFWRHLVRAAEDLASAMTIDQLGIILRGLGSMWIVVSRKECARHALYAPATGEIINIMVQEYIAQAIILTYEPERIGRFAWEVLMLAWAPWVQPASILPEPASCDDYLAAVKRFTSSVRHAMRACPGSEAEMLRRVYVSILGLYMDAVDAPVRTPTVQLSILLEQATRLPWHDHQWVVPSVIDVAYKAKTYRIEELSMWACKVIANAKAETLNICSYENGEIAADIHLYGYLLFFAANKYITDPNLINEVAQLPWWRLAETGLKEAITHFLEEFYEAEVKYYELPQFAIMLCAAELKLYEYESWHVHAKRGALVSRLARAHAAPAHAPFSQFMLNHLSYISKHIRDPRETADLLKRLICLIHPKSIYNEELRTVWMNWLACAPQHVLRPMVIMSRNLKVTQYTAPIVDYAVYAFLRSSGKKHWYPTYCEWFGQDIQPEQYIEHGALCAAYASAVSQRAAPLRPVRLLSALHTLINSNRIDYIKNEGIIVLWIVYLYRQLVDCNAEIEQAKAAENSPPATAYNAAAVKGIREYNDALKAVRENVYDQTDDNNEDDEEAYAALCAECDRINAADVDGRGNNVRLLIAQLCADDANSGSLYPFRLNGDGANAALANPAAQSAAQVEIEEEESRISAYNTRYGFTMEERECSRQTVVAILNGLGQQQRRSLLKVVTLQPDTERPTARHRVLIRLIDCLLNNSSETSRAYESALGALSGNFEDVSSWGRTPSTTKLVRLAKRLLPDIGRYFEMELLYWPNE